MCQNDFLSAHHGVPDASGGKLVSWRELRKLLTRVLSRRDINFQTLLPCIFACGPKLFWCDSFPVHENFSDL